VAKTKPPASRPSVIVLEDLNVSGMLANRKLSRAISDVGFYEFRRQLSYKAAACGVAVLLASRWEPSSKLCSACGWKHEGLTLRERVFVCGECGLVIDRDLNAALNLRLLAARQEVTPVETTSDSGNRAVVVEAGTEQQIWTESINA